MSIFPIDKMTAGYHGKQEACYHWGNRNRNLSKFFKHCIDFVLRSTLLALLQEVLTGYTETQVVEARDHFNLEAVLVPG